MSKTTRIFQDLLTNDDYFNWMISLYLTLPNSLSRPELLAIQALLALSED